MFTSRVVFVLGVFSQCLSCAVLAKGADDNTLTAETVVVALREQGMGNVSIELVQIKAMSFSLIANEAAVATVQGRAFPVRGTFLRSGNDWKLIWLDGAPVDDRLPSFRLQTKPVAPGDAAALAGEVLRVFGDPDESYALVLRSIADIPLDRRNSDFLRDLESKGLSASEKRERMLGGINFPVEEPALHGTLTRRLTFFSWSFFGGDVLRWDVKLGAGEAVVEEVMILASEVGSYDLLP